MTIRLACHDYNWIPYSRDTIDQWPLERILEEVVEAGFQAVEFSAIPREMDDPARTAELLRKFGLKLVGMTLSFKGEENAKEILRGKARFLADLDADLMVFMAGAGLRRKPGGLTEQDFKEIGGLAARLMDYGRSLGLDLVVHNHLGTLVETTGELDRFLNYAPGCGLCLDTGHLIAADEDPAEAVGRYRGVLRHVHIKDSRFHEDGSFDDFVELGEGNSRFCTEDTLAALGKAGYDAWMTLELDRTRRTPLESAKLCLAFLKAHGIGGA